MFATVLATGCTEKENDSEETRIDRSDADWVDLDLPSGLLWARYNVGASSETDYGDFFAWGETDPKGCYALSTYQYFLYDGGHYNIIKYCNESSLGYNGFTDTLTVLLPSDDAATVNFGGRMPTQEEWQELIDNTTNCWVTINGVNGRRFMGANGNCLFLPAAGRHRNDDNNCDHHANANTGGFYWSSSLDTRFTILAYTLVFNSDFVVEDEIMWSNLADGREEGCTIRAVRKP